MAQDTIKELQTLEIRSKKNRWIVGILFLISPVGYFYTNRYLLAIITTIIYFILVTTVEQYDAISVLWLLFIIGITIENITSINNAKEKVKFLQGNSSQSAHNISKPVSNVDLMILKVLENKGEMTVSQIILATELNPQIVKETLFTLEQEQLIYGYNRDSDGAIVYKNI